MIVGLGGWGTSVACPPSLWDSNGEDRESRFSHNIPAPPPQYKSHSFYQVFRGGERWQRGEAEFPGSMSPPPYESLNPPPTPPQGIPESVKNI